MRITSVLYILFACRVALSEEFEDWRDDYREWCKVPHGDPQQGELFCIRGMWNYLPLNVELLAFEPSIMAYRDLVPKHYVEEFLKDAEKKRKEEGFQVFTHDGNIATKYHPETRIERKESEGAEKVISWISHMIPVLNFTVTDPWEVIFHKRGVDKPPRFDFVENEHDERTKNHGSRFASIMLMMKKPEEAGFTIFPAINMTVELEVGDALFYTNMSPDGMKGYGSLHGDCAVGKGMKVAAYLGLRANNQFLAENPTFGMWNMPALARPYVITKELLRKEIFQKGPRK